MLNFFDISFWKNFTSGLSYTIISLILGIPIALFINRQTIKFENRNKEKNIKDKLKTAANLIWTELNFNKKQLKIMITHMPKGDLVTPSLASSSWDSIDKDLIDNYLKIETAVKLRGIYERVFTINNLYNSMIDKVNWITEGKRTTIKKQFMDLYIDRCSELLDYINEFKKNEIIDLH